MGDLIKIIQKNVSFCEIEDNSFAAQHYFRHEFVIVVDSNFTLTCTVHILTSS